MASIAGCLRQHAPAFLQRYGSSIPVPVRRVLEAITRCGTGELGHVLLQCDHCHERRVIGRSCGNRHCPNCQHLRTQAWLAKQTRRLLPVHHFLVTFTVPQELCKALRAHRRDGFTAIFDCGAETIRDVGSATKAIGGCSLGFFGVLHTWGRDPMDFHPHVHFVVPGGGVDETEGAWKATAKNFLMHHATACRVYKAKFKDRLDKLGLLDQVDPAVWDKKWNVDIKPVGSGQAVLKYLAPYVYRVAISDHRLVSFDEDEVTYKIKPSGEKHYHERSVEAIRFVGGFLQHVLPGGFQKLRYYGWQSPNHRLSLDEVRWLVMVHLSLTFVLQSSHNDQAEGPPPSCRCETCGGDMQVLLVTDWQRRVVYQRGPPDPKEPPRLSAPHPRKESA